MFKSKGPFLAEITIYCGFSINYLLRWFICLLRDKHLWFRLISLLPATIMSIMASISTIITSSTTGEIHIQYYLMKSVTTCGKENLIKSIIEFFFLTFYSIISTIGISYYCHIFWINTHLRSCSPFICLFKLPIFILNIGQYCLGIYMNISINIALIQNQI